MRITKEKAAENRAALIRAAGELFRERGIDGVGVAEISKAAGFTHGALYAQFASKEALAAEALTSGLQQARVQMAAITDGAASPLESQLDYYLSAQHRDNLADGCPMAAAASEIARQAEDISARFSDGFEQMVGVIESSLGAGSTKAARHQRALAIAASMVGGVAVARATAKSSPDLSDEILKAVRRVLSEVGGKRPGADNREKPSLRAEVKRRSTRLSN